MIKRTEGHFNHNCRAYNFMASFLFLALCLYIVDCIFGMLFSLMKRVFMGFLLSYCNIFVAGRPCDGALQRFCMGCSVFETSLP
jgi:uncharacterized membrane protein